MLSATKATVITAMPADVIVKTRKIGGQMERPSRSLSNPMAVKILARSCRRVSILYRTGLALFIVSRYSESSAKTRSIRILSANVLPRARIVTLSLASLHRMRGALQES